MAEKTCTTVLLVDDSEADCELTRELLEEISARRYVLECEQTCHFGLNALIAGKYDACLVDYSLGKETGMDFLAAASELNVTTPIIMLTGMEAREIDEQALSLGAADYLVKDDITPAVLERALRYAIERGRLLAKLSHLARHDSLTGLANRAHFQEFLEGAVARARRSEQSIGVMLIDLDEFKQINDTMGHVTGDALLRTIGSRLADTVRRGDLAARLGGDEFVVALDNVTSDEAAASIAEKAVATLCAPVSLDGRALLPKVSVGIARYNDANASAEALVRCADIAMYEAKARPGASFQIYTPPASQPAARSAASARY